MASNQRWHDEAVDNYRLEEEDLVRFLKATFGEYADVMFDVQVSPGSDDVFVFKVPRPLTKDEKEKELPKYRRRRRPGR